MYLQKLFQPIGFSYLEVSEALGFLEVGERKEEIVAVGVGEMEAADFEFPSLVRMLLSIWDQVVAVLDPYLNFRFFNGCCQVAYSYLTFTLLCLYFRGMANESNAPRTDTADEIGEWLRERSQYPRSKTEAIQVQDLRAAVKNAANLIYRRRFARTYYLWRRGSGASSDLESTLKKQQEDSAADQAQHMLEGINGALESLDKGDKGNSKQTVIPLTYCFPTASDRGRPGDNKGSKEYRIETSGDGKYGKKGGAIHIGEKIARIAILRLLGFELDNDNQIRDMPSSENLRVDNNVPGDRSIAVLTRTYKSPKNESVVFRMEWKHPQGGAPVIEESIIVG